MNILRFDHEETWAETIAALWRDRLRLEPALNVCVASGLTPLPVYARMVDAMARGTVSFAESELFALDEYGGLPPDDPGRCGNMLRRHLITGVRPKAFHVFDPDSGLVEAWTDAIRPAGGRFDLMILGLGLNGHLGLNEPGTDVASGIRRVEMSESSTRASKQYVAAGRRPTWGVTVGLREIMESAEVWLLVRGRQKADIVQKLLTGPVGPELPASFLKRHGRCLLFLDPAIRGIGETC